MVHRRGVGRGGKGSRIRPFHFFFEFAPFQAGHLYVPESGSGVQYVACSVCQTVVQEIKEDKIAADSVFRIRCYY